MLNVANIDDIGHAQF